MNAARKIELLDDQITAANDGSPAEFTLWRQNTEVVLRNVVGTANPLYLAFTKIRYGLTAWSDATPQSAWDRARRSGVREAIAILQAAKLEVELSGGVPQPTNTSGAKGQSVFVVHGRNDAKKHEVARFLRSLTGNEPVILHEQANEGRTIIEKFEHHASDVGYAVVIATGDDSDVPRTRRPTPARAAERRVRARLLLRSPGTCEGGVALRRAFRTTVGHRWHRAHTAR